MNLGISGRGAIVGGSSSGIGLACADLLLGEAVRVVLVSRGEEKLARVAASLSSKHEREVFWVAADLATPEGAATAFREAEAKLGAVDIVVNNAGGPKSGPFESLSDADWESSFHLNLMSAVRLTRLASAGMRERRWGRIVNITSTSVKQPVEGLMLSNAIRMSVVGFAKTLADELGAFGITVNTVAPGYTGTERLAELAAAKAQRSGVTKESVLEEWRSSVPLRRIGLPEEVAAAVVWLCSEQGAYITGVTLSVDGGRTRASL
ncbi:MAG: SDR family oxidoreductase [Acidobacteria bacterium]|nr:SDR family oxidoreductase [Acidobacteriota bacterium]